MAISSSHRSVSTLGTMALTALSFAGLGTTVGKGDPSQEGVAGVSTVTSLDSPTTNVDLPASPDGAPMVPERIAVMAYERGVSTSDVKLEGNQWVACVGGACQLLAKALPSEIAERHVTTVIVGLHIGERLTIHGHALSEHIVEGQATYGIPGLGTFERQKDGLITFTASSDFKGSVTKAGPPTTIPKSSVSVAHGHYTPKLASETSKILTSELDTTLVLVISVPSRCGPCRQYINDIYGAAAAFQSGTKLKFAVLDFDSFEDARRLMGKIKAFPATVIFPSIQSNTREGSGKPATSLSLSSIDRPGYQFHGRVDSHKLRGVIIGAESKATSSSKGITQVNPDSLTSNR